MADTQVNGVRITATTVKELKAEIEKLRDSLIQLSEADKNYDKKVLELQAHQAKLTEVMSLTSKATTAQVKAIGAVEDSYDALVAKGAKLRAEWRALKIGTAEWQRQAEAIKENEERLIKADEAIGRHQRKVGNYAGAISPLTNQVNQLVREVPSLAMSANQFFLAISNNLPMFVDEVKRFQQAQKELAEQGKQTQSLIGAIGKSLISWQTVIVVGLALLSKFGDKIIDGLTGLDEYTKKIDNLNKAMEGVRESISRVNSLFESESQIAKAIGVSELALAKKRKEIEEENLKVLEAQAENTKKLYEEVRQKADNGNFFQTIFSAFGGYDSILTSLNESVRNATSQVREQKTLVEQAATNVTLITKQEQNDFQKRHKENLRFLMEDKERELEILNDAFLDELTLYLKNGEDTTIVHEVYAKKRQAITEKYKEAEQKKAEEALKLRKKELEQIGKWDEEAVNSLKSEQDRELQVATTTYGKKLALYQKYGKDTTALTEAYNRQVGEINKKYRDKEAEEARRTAEEASADAYAEVQTEVKATNLKATEAERYANLLISNEGKLRERLFSIKQSALNDELSILQKSLQNDKIQGEERIAIAERVAQIQRDLAFNTAEYEKKVSNEATEKKNANTQSALQVASASASAMSSILGSIADMYEAEGEQNEQATKKAKNLRIAGATMDMLGGLVSAWTSALNPANSGLTIWGQIAMATLTSATILASGIANIQKIKNTDTSGNSSGGGIGASVSAPAIVQQVPVTRTLTGVAEEQRLNEGQRVYVVYDDIAQAGRKVDVTESEATF